MKFKGLLKPITLTIGEVELQHVPLLESEGKAYLLRLGKSLETLPFHPYFGKTIEVEACEDLQCRQLAFSEYKSVLRVSQDEESGDLALKAVLAP
jgi:hypothetical protein